MTKQFTSATKIASLKRLIKQHNLKLVAKDTGFSFTYYLKDDNGFLNLDYALDIVDGQEKRFYCAFYTENIGDCGINTLCIDYYSDNNIDMIMRRIESFYNNLSSGISGKELVDVLRLKKFDE